MDITKITKNTKAKKSREAKPISAFMDLFNATNSALEEVSGLGASDATKETLLKGHIINTVTAVEVYYRDMLDSVFRLCKPSSFNEKLKKLHDKNYKIDDLIELYVNRVHPLELVASSLSFQNTQSIDKVFSTLIGEPFFKQAKQLKWRLAEKPENEFEITYEDINTLQEIFEERHQLVHNPNQNFTLSEEVIMEKIGSIFGVIMASDLVLIQFINENIDPEITSNKKSSGERRAADLNVRTQEEIHMSADVTSIVLAGISALAGVVQAWKVARDVNKELSSEDAKKILNEDVHSIEISDEAASIIVSQEVLEVMMDNLHKAESRLIRALADPSNSSQEKDEEVEIARTTVCSELNRLLKLNGDVLPGKDLKKLWESHGCGT